MTAAEMELDFFLCEFEEQTRMIFVDTQSDAKLKVIEEFQITLGVGEDLIFKDAELQAIIRDTDIPKLMNIARKRNMNFKILCESTIT